MNQISEIAGVGQEFLAVVFLVFLRIGAAMALLPVVGERSVPQKVRLAITLVYTTVVSLAVFEDFGPLDATSSRFILSMGFEISVGLAMGFGLRAFVFALQIAGSIVAQSTSLSQIFGGAAADPQPAIGHLLVAAGLALAVTFGLHIQIAEFLIISFEVISLGNPVSAEEFAGWGLKQISSAFSLAFSLAAPFVLASLIYNIALGAINKAMPQLMVSFVGAPAVTAGGLLLLLICAPILLTVWQTALNEFFENPFDLAR